MLRTLGLILIMVVSRGSEAVVSLPRSIRNPGWRDGL